MSLGNQSTRPASLFEERLLAGPLHVRSFWDAEKTAELPRKVLARRRRQFVGRSTFLAAVCGGMFLWGAIAYERQTSESAKDRTVSAPTLAPRTGANESHQDAGVSLALGDAGQAIYKDLAKVVWQEEERLVRVEQGTVRLVVDTPPGNSIRIQAGLRLLHVIRSSFILHVEGDETRISVLSGAVKIVTAEGEEELVAGQKLRFSGDSPKEQSTDLGQRSEEEPTSGAAHGARPSFTNWRNLAREGDYGGAFAAMQKAPASIQRTPADLMLASDVARQSGHPLQASEYLMKVMNDFPSDPRAPLAAFTRGRIQLENLNSPAAAAASFAACRKISPSGPLAEDALLRQAEASASSGNHAEGQRLAQRYMDSYPAGRHRSRCEKILSAH